MTDHSKSQTQLELEKVHNRARVMLALLEKTCPDVPLITMELRDQATMIANLRVAIDIDQTDLRQARDSIKELQTRNSKLARDSIKELQTRNSKLRDELTHERSTPLPPPPPPTIPAEPSRIPITVGEMEWGDKVERKPGKVYTFVGRDPESDIVFYCTTRSGSIMSLTNVGGWFKVIEEPAPTKSAKPAKPAPPSRDNEPPVGTWIKDSRGAASVRINDGWAPSPTGFYGGGKWTSMWDAHGPLELCGPYGAPLEEDS